MLSVSDVLEILSIPLLGIIPEDQEILRASNVGAPVTMGAGVNNASKAYREAAKRLMGETLPIAVPGERKTFFNRIFGRRAA